MHSFYWLNCGSTCLKQYVASPEPVSSQNLYTAHYFINKCFVPVAQHHGKSVGERRETGWSCGKVRASGEPIQSLLQDCKCWRLILLTLVWKSNGHSLFRCLTTCMCVHVVPAGTETELVLWNHVMSLPRPRGRASLCLSAFPTTPIMHPPPALNTVDRTDAVESGMGGQDKSKKGWKVVASRSVISPDCDWWGLKEWWGLVGGRSNIWIIFNLFKGWTSVWCFNTSWGYNSVTLCIGDLLLKNVFKPFNVIQIQSDLNRLLSSLKIFWKCINHGCVTASRQLWQSHSLILWIHKMCRHLGSVLQNPPLFFSCRHNLCCPLDGSIYLLYCSSEPQWWGQSKNSNVRQDHELLLGCMISKSHLILRWFLNIFSRLDLVTWLLCFSLSHSVKWNLKHSRFGWVCYWVMMCLEADDEKWENRCEM